MSLVGGQGALLATDRLNGASSLHVIAHGTATEIYALGDGAPGASSADRCRCIRSTARMSYLPPSYSSPPRCCSLTAARKSAPSLGSGVIQHLPVPEGATYDLRRNDAGGKFLASRVLSPFSTEHWSTDGITHGTPIVLERTPNQILNLRGITAGGAFRIDEQVATDDFTRSFRIFFLGTRQDEIASAIETSSGFGKGAENAIIGSVALNSIGDVLTSRITGAGDQLFLHRADGVTELVAETGQNSCGSRGTSAMRS